jgi:hypothetical protein
MEEKSLADAGYWRNSLADAELGRGGLSRSDVGGFAKIPAEKLTAGVMPSAIVGTNAKPHAHDAPFSSRRESASAHAAYDMPPGAGPRLPHRRSGWPGRPS